MFPRTMVHIFSQLLPCFEQAFVKRDRVSWTHHLYGCSDTTDSGIAGDLVKSKNERSLTSIASFDLRVGSYRNYLSQNK